MRLFHALVPARSCEVLRCAGHRAMGGLTVALFGGGKRKLLTGSGTAPLQHAGEHAGRKHEGAGAHRQGSPSHRVQGHLGHAFAHDSHRDAAVERAVEAPSAKPEAESERLSEVETETVPKMHSEGEQDAT